MSKNVVPNQQSEDVSRHQPISAADLDALRGPDPDQAFHQIFAKTRRWVMHWGWLATEDVDDVTMQAINDVGWRIWRSNMGVSELNRHFVTAIDRNRKRAQRFRDRVKQANLPPRSDHSRAQLDARDAIVDVVRLIEGQLKRALRSLSAKDRALIVRHYSLEAVGFDSSDDYFFPSRAAYRRAMYRARKRFADQLIHLLERRRDRSERNRDREVIEEVLNTIENGRLDVVPFGKEKLADLCA